MSVHHTSCENTDACGGECLDGPTEEGFDRVRAALGTFPTWEPHATYDPATHSVTVKFGKTTDCSSASPWRSGCT